MTKARILGVALAFVSGTAIWASADDKDDKHSDDVKLEQLPEKAQAKVKKEVGDGYIKDIEREAHPHEKGVFYKVEYRSQKGDDYQFTVTADGKVLDKRREY